MLPLAYLLNGAKEVPLLCPRLSVHQICAHGQFAMMPINEEIPEECLSLKGDFKYIKFGYLIKIWNGRCHILYNPLTLMSILSGLYQCCQLDMLDSVCLNVPQPNCCIVHEYWQILKLFQDLLSFQMCFHSDESGHVSLLLHLLLFIRLGIFGFTVMLVLVSEARILGDAVLVLVPVKNIP